jgi:ribosomal protein S30
MIGPVRRESRSSYQKRVIKASSLRVAVALKFHARYTQ